MSPIQKMKSFFYRFPMHITIILEFKVILSRVIYIITIFIKNSIDMLINIDCFEIEKGQFSQIVGNFVLCLHCCPSVGI
jgi:hypothetical protein